MIIFAVLLATMIVVALVILLSAFRSREAVAVDREDLNVSIARERLAELEAARDSGELNAEDFTQARTELELGLAADLVERGASGRRGGKALLLVLMALVPALAIGLYLQLGSPQFLDAVGPGAGRIEGAAELAAGTAEPASVEEMVVTLQARLAENPNDPDGWYMLGRSYMSLNRYPDGVTAYEKLVELTERHPAALVALADALAMTQEGRMAGRPAELIAESLAIEPNDPTALWLAGQAAEEQGEHKAAVEHWMKALPAMAEQPELAEQLRTQIAQAAIAAGMSIDDLAKLKPANQAMPLPTEAQQPATTSAAAVRVRVRIAPAMLGDVGPDDTVFVFARALSGPPMPLAVGRYTLATLPAEIILDDSSAMAPQLRISGYPEVNVQARVAKGGEPTAQPGDLQSDPVQVAVGDSGVVELLIDSKLP